MNLSDLILRTCHRVPDRLALVEGDRSLTYDELERQIRLWAGRLIEKGGHGRETVALLAPNGLEFVTAYLGALAAGKSALPLNPMLTVEELAYILADAAVETLVVARPFAEKAEALRAVCPKLQYVLASGLLEDGPEGAGFTNQHDMATLLYTSGTTGKPKGVMLTHGNLMANVEGCMAVLNVTEEDRFLAVLPFFHAFGITGSLVIPLVAGAAVEVMPSIAPARILAALTERGATVLLAVPSVFGMLARVAPERPTHSLRLAIAGGEPLPERIFRAWEARFGLALQEGYGATETAPVISLTPAASSPRPGRAGKPLPNLQVRVAGPDGVLAGGAIGELQVKGPSVMRGYLNRPRETGDVLSLDGWYRTGDLGFVDDEGYIHITGRQKDLIISAGENIYPAEIEELLRTIPGIAEAAVIGVPDAVRGEVPKAVICTEQGQALEIDAIQAQLKGRLAEYKWPRIFEFRAELPRNATGKVQKTALR